MSYDPYSWINGSSQMRSSSGTTDFESSCQYHSNKIPCTLTFCVPDRAEPLWLPCFATRTPYHASKHYQHIIQPEDTNRYKNSFEYKHLRDFATREIKIKAGDFGELFRCWHIQMNMVRGDNEQRGCDRDCYFLWNGREAKGGNK